MITRYCRERHGTDGRLCRECAELRSYAQGRLERCPYGDEKPKCSECRIHCYRPAFRERITKVMRLAVRS